jgi:hypothetical protein
MAEFELPWEDIEASRRDRRLQNKHPLSESEGYRASAKPCTRCHAPPEQLTWFYLKSPKETWPVQCGTEGWIVVCDKCRRQVQYFDEVVS